MAKNKIINPLFYFYITNKGRRPRHSVGGRVVAGVNPAEVTTLRELLGEKERTIQILLSQIGYFFKRNKGTCTAS